MTPDVEGHRLVQADDDGGVVTRHDKVVNIATTNYPEDLDKRLVSRPRRFDRILKITSPDINMRFEYLKRKLGSTHSHEDIVSLANLSDGLSFAALADLVISVCCLGNDLDETITPLRGMSRTPSSREYDNPGEMGFGGNQK